MVDAVMDNNFLESFIFKLEHDRGPSSRYTHTRSHERPATASTWCQATYDIEQPQRRISETCLFAGCVSSPHSGRKADLTTRNLKNR